MRANAIPLRCICVLACLMALPATASAAQRFAAPSPSGAGDCSTAADACSLPTAVSMAGDGDEVVVGAGDYSLSSTLVSANAISIHGAAGQPLPVLNTTGSHAFSLNHPALTISDLKIEHTGSGGALFLAAGTAERLFVHAAGSSGTACSLIAGAVVRNSVCWADRAAGGTAGIETSGTGGTVTLRNVTAVAAGGDVTSRGINAFVGSGGSMTVNATNVIARGLETDVYAGNFGSGTVDVVLSNSNYATETESGAGLTVTDPGSGSNQTAAPAFIDAAGGDFHQAAGSPTIDAGTSSGVLPGELDFDGEQRTQGPVPDIGADERDSDPPDTTITGGPSGNTTDRTPDFTFSANESGSTFQCEVDGGGYFSCGGEPGQVTLGSLALGFHTLSVRAIDSFGNTDPTPATQSFTIVDPPEPPPGVDTDPPETTIVRVRVRGDDAKVKFRSDEPASAFKIKLDRRPYIPVRRNPTRFRNLAPGRHKVKVFATDASGNADPTPARARFKIKP
jgi:hypothetical protein